MKTKNYRPSLRRGDEIAIQADPERESRRMRNRFEDLIRARFGHDGDVSERRQRTGRFSVIQITPLRRQNQQRDDTSNSEDKPVKIKEKFFDPPAIFRQQYVKVAVLKLKIPERECAL
uniref:Uncharacterized protein n=1 Tax=Panagrolaimus davidi TaxID=227884 RepID=A0A914PRS2_9BILA